MELYAEFLAFAVQPSSGRLQLANRSDGIDTDLRHTAASAADNPSPCAEPQSVPALPAGPPAGLQAADAAMAFPSWGWLQIAASE